MAGHGQAIPITLAQAKNSLLNFINPNISLTNLREMNPNMGDLEVNADDIFLQIRIIFHTPDDVDYYLQNYLTAHGPNRLGELMNRGIPLMDTHFRISPLDCATLWTDNDDMVQLMYDWGSNANFTPVQGARHEADNFENNLANIPYFNHLENFNLLGNFNNNNNYNYPPVDGTRNLDEFRDTINQRIWQASGQNMAFPGRRVINILNRRHRRANHQV